MVTSWMEKSRSDPRFDYFGSPEVSDPGQVMESRVLLGFGSNVNRPKQGYPRMPGLEHKWLGRAPS
jgi:hypothetical protein